MHSISLLSLFETNQSINLCPVLLHHSLIGYPIIDDELERTGIVVSCVPRCVLIYLYTRPEGYSERTGQVWALLLSTSVRFAHIVGEVDILLNHIILRSSKSKIKYPMAPIATLMARCLSEGATGVCLYAVG